MTHERSEQIIAALKQYYGDPAPSLRCGNLYETAVSVILSAQTTDAQVNAVTPVLFARYPDFENLSRARISSVEAIIKSTGFYKNKARHIIEMARGVMERFGGKLPERREELMTLQGIGRKSANVIISMGHGKPAMAVDTHVLRVANRLGYCSTSNPLEVEKTLTRYIAEKDWTTAHLLLITHGRKLCGARKPFCGVCPLNPFCDYAGSIP